MDYAKYALALQLLQVAKPEIAAAIVMKTKKEPIATLPSDNLEAIVLDTLDEVEKVMVFIDEWEETQRSR